MNRPSGRPPTPIHQRFWSKVRIDNACDGSCWEWYFSTDKAGYGRFQAYGENYAHRVSWKLSHGKIPKGMMVLHRCDNPKCVNPDHLFLGTGFDNMQDRLAKGRNPDFRGEKNPYALLTWGIVAEVRRRITAGESQAVVADSMNIGRTLVGKIWHNQVWKIKLVEA